MMVCVGFHVCCSVLQSGPPKASMEEGTALPQGDVPIIEALAKGAEGEIL